MTDVDSRTDDTLAASIGRARHSLQALHDPSSATVTVHGRCPDAPCGRMHVVQVHADTRDFTCPECATHIEV